MPLFFVFRLVVLECIFSLSWLRKALLGDKRKGMVMLGWKGVVLFWRSLGLSRLCSALSFGGATFALQAFWPGHLGVDNLDVVRSLAQLLDHICFSKPTPLVKDGDLIAIVKHMIVARGPFLFETVRVEAVFIWSNF